MKRILYCVLDWGLGHATRSIPIISLLTQNECEVQIASNGQALDFLKDRFPELAFHELIGYDARYPTSSVHLNMLLMIYRLRKAMNIECQQVDKIVNDFRPHIIISDNRYGCYHVDTLNVLLSHQLRLPARNKLEQFTSNFFLSRKLTPFNEIWVPDHQPPYNLSGEMSELEDERVKYIGPLSSITPVTLEQKKNQLLILLSGPEPARSKLEQAILSLGLSQYFDCELIRGTKMPLKGIVDKIKVTDVGTSEEVAQAICSAEYIICRSGYSTIMDLQKLKRRAIFVPTPGQPEQKYLAYSMTDKNLGYYLNESRLSLDLILKAMNQIDGMDELNNISDSRFKPDILRLLNLN